METSAKKRGLTNLTMWYNSKKNLIRKEMVSMAPKMMAPKINTARKKRVARRKPGRCMIGISSTVPNNTRFTRINLNKHDSTYGEQDAALTQNFITAVRVANQVKTMKGLPISKYDKNLKKAFIEYPDGKKVYV